MQNTSSLDRSRKSLHRLSKPYRKRERLGHLERRPDVEPQQLARHQRRRALGAVLEYFEQDVAFNLDGLERAVQRRRAGGGRERERGRRGRARRHVALFCFSVAVCVQNGSVELLEK